MIGQIKHVFLQYYSRTRYNITHKQGSGSDSLACIDRFFASACISFLLLGAPPDRCACAYWLWRVLFHACSLVVCVAVRLVCFLACMEADNSNQRIFAQLVESKRMTKPLFYHNYSHVVARNCWCAFASSSLRVQQRFLADVGFDIR